MAGSKQKAISKAAIESQGDIFDDGVYMGMTIIPYILSAYRVPPQQTASKEMLLLLFSLLHAMLQLFMHCSAACTLGAYKMSTHKFARIQFSSEYRSVSSVLTPGSSISQSIERRISLRSELTFNEPRLSTFASRLTIPG